MKGRKDMTIKIGNNNIGKLSPTFIIAEIGATHAGSLERAFKLIKLAKKAGANAVKLQTVNPDFSYTRKSLSYKIFKKLNFSFEDLVKIKKEAKKNNLLIFSTPGDFPSLELIKKLNFPIIKISSGLMTNIPLIEEVAKTKKPIFISSGMAFMDEISKSVRILQNSGAKDILAFHCTSEYPCQDKNVNLSAIKHMHETLKLPVGFSDHTKDILASTLAISFGAVAIEKHLAVSDSLAGPEKGTACNPKEFSELVKNIRRAESIIGNGEKRPSELEMVERKVNRRTIFSVKKINKNEVFSKKNLGLMRGNLDKGLGLPPDVFNSLLGKHALTKIDKNEPIKIGMISKDKL